MKQPYLFKYNNEQLNGGNTTKNKKMKTHDSKTVTLWEKKVLEKMFHLSQIKELEKKIETRWGHPQPDDKSYLNMIFSDEYDSLTQHVGKILQINRWLEKKKWMGEEKVEVV